MCEAFCDADRERVLHEGEPLLQPTLAEFLTQVARRGASYLYHDMADALAQEVRDAGGVLTAEDVRNYTVMHRRPLYSYYRGFEVIGAPPPSAGGAVIGMALNWLEGFGLWRRGHSRQSAQLLAEALKYGFANRPRLGDPAFVPDADAFARQRDGRGRQRGGADLHGELGVWRQIAQHRRRFRAQRRDRRLCGGQRQQRLRTGAVGGQRGGTAQAPAVVHVADAGGAQRGGGFGGGRIGRTAHYLIDAAGAAERDRHGR
eukprot:ctg_1133.g253